MEERIKKAAETFGAGFNCSQSVFSVFAEGGGVDENTALRIGGAFGGGCARQGEICGAVSGGLMALGLFMGRDRAGDEEVKRYLYDRSGDFMSQFKTRHGTLICRELLEYDLSTPEGAEKAEELNLFETRCPGFVETAVQLVEEILQQEKRL